MSSPDLSTEHKGRLLSILRQHAALFGRGLVTASRAVEREDADLIASLDGPTEAQAGRITSILRQHELLFGRGMVLGQREAIVEDDLLIEALAPRETRPEAAPAAGLSEPPAAAPVLEPRPHSPSPSAPPSAPRPRDPFGRYRLFGPGRRRRIGEPSGIVALWCRGPGPAAASLLLVPLSTVRSHAVRAEPARFRLEGPLHAVLVEPAAAAGSGHPEWPRPLGEPPSAVLAIRTAAGDRICLGLLPVRASGGREIVAAAETGLYPYFFPGGAGVAGLLTRFVAYVLSSHAAVTRNDAEGIAWFAVRRILAPG